MKFDKSLVEIEVLFDVFFFEEFEIGVQKLLKIYWLPQVSLFN